MQQPEVEREATQFTLLNGVEVHCAGTVLELGPPQRRAVLCLLAIRRRQWVSAQSVVSALYESELPPGGISVVQTHVSALRRILEPHRRPRTAPAVLLSGHGGYQLLITDEQLDLGVLDRLVREAESARDRGDWDAAQHHYRQGLEVFSGEPLAGVPGPYATAQRAALIERRISILEDFLAAAIAANRADQVIDRLRMLIAEYPLRERPPALLMRALQAAGRRSDALDVYMTTRRVLVDELGVEPGPELRTLHGHILAGKRLPGGDTVVVPTVAAHVRSNGELPVVGRAPELARLGALADRAIAGFGGFAVVVGYRGHGKSAILRELAHSGHAMRTVRLNAETESAAGQLGLLWQICTTVADSGVSTDADDRQLSEKLVRRLTAVATDQPMLLLIDDIGRADERSIRVLTATVPRLHALRILLVAAMEEDPAMRERQSMLERSADAVVRVGTLDSAAVTKLVTNGLGATTSPELIAEIHRASAGIPDLVVALITDTRTLPDRKRLPDRLPEGAYTAAIRRQLTTATPKSLETYRAIAALPVGSASLSMIAEVVGEPLDDTRDRCELLVAAEVLESADPPLFRHPLIGNTLRHVLAPLNGARVFLVAARHARLAGKPASEIAQYLHGLSGEQYSEWTTVLIAVADECLAERAFDDARRHLEAALRITGPDLHAEVLLRLGKLEQFTNPVVARAHLEEALRAQRATGVAPSALIPLLWTMAAQKETDAGFELMDEVLAETEPRNPVAARAVHASHWVIAAMRPETWTRYVAQLRRDDTDPIAAAVVAFDSAFGVGCSARDALERFSKAMSRNDGPAPRELTGMLAQLALWADDLTLAWQVGDQRDDRLFGSVDAYRTSFRIEILCRRAEFDRAVAECGPLTTIRDGVAARCPPVLATYQAYALIGLGRIEEAAAWLDRASAEVNPELGDWVVVNTARGVLASVQGHPRAAASHFLESGRRAADWGFDNPGFLPWRSLAAKELARLGDIARAARLAAVELELARRWNTDRSIGVALRAVAYTAPVTERTALLGEAVQHLRRSESITQLLPALLDLARAYRAVGKNDTARTTLVEAHAIAEPRRAVLFLNRIEALWQTEIDRGHRQRTPGSHERRAARAMFNDH
ncbi:BTAD domain-containing putative transcriptional regulator [Nocardia terpenica]